MRPGTRRRRAAARVVAAAVIAVLTAAAGAGAIVQDGAGAGDLSLSALDRGDWLWPFTDFRVERPYEAPAHRYGAGHRGIDLRSFDGLEARAPADGVIAFSGPVAGRGILTIDHGGGLVTTLEPIDSALVPGAVVAAGAVVGTVALGGHAAPGSLHFGVRLDGEYINPMLLLGGVPRAVLLPCC